MRIGGALLLSLLASQASASPPDWATHDTQKLVGNRYEAVCTGEGPSLADARQEAVDSCTVSAAQHLPRKLTVRSLSVSSEVDAAWQQEVVGKSQVANLVCNPQQEKIEETESKVKVWLRCEFDLAKAKRWSAPFGRKLSDSRTGLDPLVPDQLALKDPRENRVLTLAVVPACSSLIVSGGSPARVVRCDRNPVSVIVEPGDREVLVRSKGMLPKRIALTRSKARQYARIVLAPAG